MIEDSNFSRMGWRKTSSRLLARVPGFFLISRASSFAFDDPKTPTSVIAEKLGSATSSREAYAAPVTKSAFQLNLRKPR